MSRLTGNKRPGKYAKNQCPFCNRFFQDVKKHQAMASACQRIRGIKN